MDPTAVAVLLDRLPLIDVPQTRLMRALWDGGDAKLRQRAWHRGRSILEQRGAERVYQQASDTVGRWMRDHATGRVGQPYEIYETVSDQMRLDSRIAAAPPILDAILATLLDQELADDEREELLGPWTIALADDPLPEEATPDGPANGTTR